MNVRKKIPQASAAIVQWTKQSRALRVSLNGPLLKQLRWTDKTTVGFGWAPYDFGILIYPATNGYKLHKRSLGKTRTVVFFDLRKLTTKLAYSRLLDIKVVGRNLKFSIPKDFRSE